MPLSAKTVNRELVFFDWRRKINAVSAKPSPTPRAAKRGDADACGDLDRAA